MLGIGVTAGGPLMVAIGVLAAAGVTLSALFARSLPREIEVGPTVGGVLKNIANRDLFYILLLGATVLRWLAPADAAALLSYPRDAELAQEAV